MVLVMLSQTHFQAAVFVPQTEIVALLLAKGANPDITNSMGVSARQVWVGCAKCDTVGCNGGGKGSF